MSIAEEVVSKETASNKQGEKIDGKTRIDPKLPSGFMDCKCVCSKFASYA